MTMTGVTRKSGVKLLAAATLCLVLGAMPAAAQDSRAIGGAAGAAGGAGIGYGLGGTKGAIIGGLIGAGLGVGAGHVVRENNKRNEENAVNSNGTYYPYQDNLVFDTKNELAALGYQPGPMDNSYDQQTVWAVRSYQHNSGLYEDGQPSAALLDHMRQTRARLQGYQQPSGAYQQPTTYQQGSYVPPPAAPVTTAPATSVKPVAAKQLDMSDCAVVNRGTVVNGKETVEKVKACRQPDGSYEYVK